MTLRELVPGEVGTIISVGQKGPVRRRLMDMGVTPGVDVKIIKVAPLGDPIEINIRGYELSLRKDEAEQIEVENK
ncbi:MAG: FeoA family protein [Clostridium sp.]